MLSGKGTDCTGFSMACTCILTLVCAWLLSGISTHTSEHTQKPGRQLSQTCSVFLYFFQSRALSATEPQQHFYKHPGKGVRYLLFVTASNSKILKSQLSSLSRSCAIQGGTSLMVFGTER